MADEFQKIFKEGMEYVENYKSLEETVHGMGCLLLGHNIFGWDLKAIKKDSEGYLLKKKETCDNIERIRSKYPADFFSDIDKNYDFKGLVKDFEIGYVEVSDFITKAEEEEEKKTN
ncbi:MAG: hypothetical protein PHH54_02030 [Candidatus Nanoarchaeia archaeon]|nr:hypothetical protein [Candidatus Nanoarchaeia archaeon]MDD5740741.1 hypothetical protein [Candidatus Nanoarchaeia archaeon]